MRLSQAFRYFLFIVTILVVGSCRHDQDQSVYSIAYVGRYTDINATTPRDNRFDLAHEHMLRAYIGELNEQLETKKKGIAFQLKTFDSQCDSKESAKAYEQISQDSSIVAVIDNTWGEHLAGATDVIREQHIPLISINADHNFKAFGSQAIFTGNNDLLPGELNAFLKKIVHAKDVVFISEEDYALHDHYLTAFQRDSIQVAATFTIRSKATDKDAAFDSLRTAIDKAFKENLALAKKYIVINLHYQYGTRLLNYFDEHYTHLHMIGHAYIFQTVSTDILKNNGNELILISNPTDAVSKKIALDMDEFKKEKPEVFQNMVSPMFPKRCQDAMSIINGYFQSKQATSLNRESMRSYFRSLSNTILRTENDLLYFNQNNELLPDLYYVQYKEGRLYSFREQLNSRKQAIPNIICGMEIVDLYNIDVTTNTFQADYFYWIKADTANRECEKFILFPNMKESGSVRSLILEKEEKGLMYKLYRVSGLFYQDFNLKDYPLDKQEVVIKMEVLNAADKLKIAFDQSAFKQDTNLLEKFKVNAWVKDKYMLTVDNRISSTMRGDPESIEGELKKFQVFSFRLFLHRSVVGPFLEIILPLLLIGLVAISLLFVRNVAFENVGEVSVGTFLGIITFSIAIASVSPSSDYVTKSDLLFWLTFMVVLTCFLTIIVINSKYDEGEMKDLKIIKKARWIITAVYLAGTALIFSW